MDSLACPQVTTAFSLYNIQYIVFMSRNSSLSQSLTHLFKEFPCLRITNHFLQHLFAVGKESGCVVTASDYMERYDDICNIFGEHGRATDILLLVFDQQIPLKLM